MLQQLLFLRFVHEASSLPVIHRVFWIVGLEVVEGPGQLLLDLWVPRASLVRLLGDAFGVVFLR